jgi:hypothetical protein
MRKASRPLIIFIAAIFQPIVALAQSDETANIDYETYEKTGVIAAEMGTQFINENIVAIRTAATLKYCSKEGLAKSVEAKETDRQLEDKLQTFVLAGRFDKLPLYAIYEAQSAASNLIIGYNMGFLAGLRLSAETVKSSLCDVAVNAANQLLAK